MTPSPIDLLVLLIDCGTKLNNARAIDALEYIETLWKRERLVVIHDENGVQAWATFLMFEPEDFVIDKDWLAKRKAWTIPQDRRTGSLCYIDFLVARTWTPSLRKALTQAIVLRHPRIRHARWNQMQSQEVGCHG